MRDQRQQFRISLIWLPKLQCHALESECLQIPQHSYQPGPMKRLPVLVDSHDSMQLAPRSVLSKVDLTPVACNHNTPQSHKSAMLLLKGCYAQPQAQPSALTERCLTLSPCEWGLTRHSSIAESAAACVQDN